MIMTRFFNRSIVALVASILFLALSVNSASAHGKFKSSNPAPNSTVAAAPAQVVVSFDNHDPLDITGSKLVVTDASGAVVDMGDSALDKNDADRLTLVVTLKSGLGDGVYTVNWTALSEGDGSLEEGHFSFTVKADAPATTPPTTMPQTGAADSLPFLAVVAGALLIAAGAIVRRKLA
jgi:LPXTG-motif cell wall-anchored protein